MSNRKCQCVDCRRLKRLKEYKKKHPDGPSQYPPELRRMLRPSNLPGIYVLKDKFTRKQFEEAKKKYTGKACVDRN